MEMVNHLRKFPALLFKGKAVEEAIPPAPEFKIIETLIDQELALNLKDIHKLDIDAKSALLKLEFTNDDRARVSLQGQLKAAENQPSPILEAQREGSTQSVFLKFPTALQPIHCQLLISLYLPNSYRQSIAIQSTSGDIHIKSGHLADLQLSTISGNLNIAALRAKSHRLKTISGCISLSNIEGTIDATSTSGDITIEASAIDNKIHINTTSGNSIIKLPSGSGILLDGMTITGKLVQPLKRANPAWGKTEYRTDEICLRSISGDLQLIQE